MFGILVSHQAVLAKQTFVADEDGAPRRWRRLTRMLGAVAWLPLIALTLKKVL